MKAMVLTAARSMEMREMPAPVIERGDDVLLRTTSVGVCGSDVHYYGAGRIGSQVVEYPWILGHEMAAVVEAVGPNVATLEPGDRVAVDPAISCGACDQCRGGRPHTCRELRFLACPGQVQGCLAEYVVMPAGTCFKVADDTTDDRAALCEPLSIGCYAAGQAALPSSSSIAILGAGPIGLSVMLAARARGIERIYMTDKLEERLAIAAGSCAFWTGNPDRDDIVSAVTGREPARMDAVFECCGEQDAMDQAIDLLKPGGTLFLIGIPPELERVSFRIDPMRRNEIRIQNVRRQNGCFPEAIELVEQQRCDADFMITHQFALEQAAEAFDLVAGYRDGVVKAMVHVHQSQS